MFIILILIFADIDILDSSDLYNFILTVVIADNLNLTTPFCVFRMLRCGRRERLHHELGVGELDGAVVLRRL